MPNSTSTVVAPKSGLVSPAQNFTSGLQNQNLNPSTGGTTTTGIAPTQGGGFLGLAPAVSGIVSNITGANQVPGYVAPSATPQATSSSITSGGVPGYVAPSAQSSNATSGATGGTSVYQQNLAKYGLSSIPTGYSFNANGSLVNGSGQEYTSPSNVGNTNTNQNSGTGTSGVNSTFPGLVSSLATTASQPSGTYTQNQNTSGQVQNGLINLQDPNSQLNQPVTADTNAVNQLQDQYAAQQGIIGNSPIGLSEQGGEQGLLNSQYATKLGAAQTALNTATTNRQQQIGALESAGGLANTAASNATGQQGTQQSGTATAAGLAQPSLAAPGQSYANPQTGQFGNIAGAQNGGGIASVGGLQTQIQQGAAVQSMSGIYQQAQGLASSLTSAINSSGYNPAQGIGAATTYANGVNQWLQSNSGNPQYQNVANLVSEVANKYAAILNQSGGTPTSVSQVQQQIINGLASGQDIETTLGNLATNAQTSINALQGASGTNSVNGTSNTNNSSGGATFGSFF